MKPLLKGVMWSFFPLWLDFLFIVVGEDDLGEVSFGHFCTNPFPLQIYYGMKMLVSGKE